MHRLDLVEERFERPEIAEIVFDFPAQGASKRAFDEPFHVQTEKDLGLRKSEAVVRIGAKYQGRDGEAGKDTVKQHDYGYIGRSISFL